MGCFHSNPKSAHGKHGSTGNAHVLHQKIKRGILIKSFNFDNLNLNSLSFLDTHPDTLNIPAGNNISVFSACNNKLTSDNFPILFFNKIGKITKIDFSFNQFATIPGVICNLHFLNFLNFSNNLINFIPHEINNLENLKELDLSSNNIKEIPNHFRGLKSLENLNVSYNNIANLNNEIICLPKLETLNIAHNKIEALELEGNYWEKSNLKNLDISFNRLKGRISIAPNLMKSSNISNLNLKGNSITRKELVDVEGYVEFEKRRKERKEQGYLKNLDIEFDLCGLDH